MDALILTSVTSSPLDIKSVPKIRPSFCRRCEGRHSCAALALPSFLPFSVSSCPSNAKNHPQNPSRRVVFVPKGARARAVTRRLAWTKRRKTTFENAAPRGIRPLFRLVAVNSVRLHHNIIFLCNGRRSWLLLNQCLTGLLS